MEKYKHLKFHWCHQTAGYDSHQLWVFLVWIKGTRTGIGPKRTLIQIKQTFSQSQRLKAEQKQHWRDKPQQLIPPKIENSFDSNKPVTGETSECSVLLTLVYQNSVFTAAKVKKDFVLCVKTWMLVKLRCKLWQKQPVKHQSDGANLDVSVSADGYVKVHSKMCFI